MNQSFAFSRDVNLGRLCSQESALELSQESLHLSAIFLLIYWRVKLEINQALILIDRCAPVESPYSQ